MVSTEEEDTLQADDERSIPNFPTNPIPPITPIAEKATSDPLPFQRPILQRTISPLELSPKSSACVVCSMPVDPSTPAGENLISYSPMPEVSSIAKQNVTYIAVSILNTASDVGDWLSVSQQ